MNDETITALKARCESEAAHREALEHLLHDAELEIDACRTRLEHERTKRDDARASLAQVRRDLDTMIRVHDETVRERDELRERVEIDDIVIAVATHELTTIARALGTSGVLEEPESVAGPALQAIQDLRDRADGDAQALRDTKLGAAVRAADANVAFLKGQIQSARALVRPDLPGPFGDGGMAAHIADLEAQLTRAKAEGAREALKTAAVHVAMKTRALEADAAAAAAKDREASDE